MKSWLEKLIYQIKALLKKNPFLFERIKKLILFNNKYEFEPIDLGTIKLHFALGPLHDRRGIGRVSRELLTALKGLQSEQIKSRTNAEKNLYFYQSIHWCPSVLPRPCIVMVHDVIPLVLSDIFPRAIVSEWLNRYKKIVQQADHIVTVSKTSADDIARYLGVGHERISVIYNGVSKLPINTEVQVPLPTNPFVVFVGSSDYHKNPDVVLQALTSEELKDVHLVMIGDNRGCLNKAKELGVDDRVHFLGRLNDGDMGWVISQAKALVFPSLYEGFGLPPLEAARLGTPSICSNRPAMTEILKSGALFADPMKPSEWASAIQQLVTNSNLRNHLVKEAEKEITPYDWSRMARLLLDVIVKVM